MNNNLNMSKVYRIKKKNNRIAQVRKQKTLTLIILTIAIITCSCITSGLLSSAHGNTSEEPIYFTYYTEYEIVYGDSLWTIASNIEVNDMTTKQIVKEIKSINQMSSDAIFAGEILIVPYTSTEFK